VLHCSYCHGWEVSGKRIGVLGAPGGASYQASVFRRFSDHVTIITHDWEGPGDDERDSLAKAGVTLRRARILRLVIDADCLVGIELDDGSVLELDALVVSPRIMARADLLQELGITVEEARIGDVLIGTYVPPTAGVQSAVHGLYLAGNVAYVGAQVARSSADGMSAGVMIDEALASEDATGGPAA
jgi:thioredoxin reductase